MQDNITAPAEQQNTENAENQQIEHPHPDILNRRRKLVVAGVILTVLGWVLMPCWPWVSLTLSALAVVASSIGVRIPPGPRRNVAITAIIAASVLIVVFLTFLIAINVIV